MQPPVDNLKQKTTSALVWNIIDKAGFQVIALAVGIITARLLLPHDFGLIGALAIFTGLSNVLIDSGFGAALVRRQENSAAEYSAIFQLNVGLSLVIYVILFACAPFIADFFHMPELCSLSRFLFLSIVINSMGIVQNIVLTRQLAFRQTATINVMAAVVAGVATVAFVLLGFGYWALAWQLVLQSLVRTALLWYYGSWRLSFRADFRIVREVFSFSIFLLITAVTNGVVKNIYSLFIGRLYSAEQLGFYSQANKFQQIPSTVIASAQTGTAYPVLVKLNDDLERQKLYIRKIMRITSFMIFPVMIGMLSITESLVSIVLTDKWLPAAPYFQLLVAAAIVTPFISLNSNLIAVKGDSKLYFRLELLRNALIFTGLLFCMNSIELMMLGFSVANVLAYFCYMFFVSRKTGYRIFEQLKDILPYGIISAAMFLTVKTIGLLPLGLYSTTALQIVSAAMFYFAAVKLLGSQIFSDILELFLKKKSA